MRLIKRIEKDSEQFYFCSGADDPALCCHTGAHSPPTGQGWELQFEITIDHPQCNLSKVMDGLQIFRHCKKNGQWWKIFMTSDRYMRDKDVNSQLWDKKSQLSFKMFYSVAKTSFHTRLILMQCQLCNSHQFSQWTPFIQTQITDLSLASFKYFSIIIVELGWTNFWTQF